MTRTTLRRLPVTLAVLLVAMTGCSNDPEPRIADPPPASGSTTSAADEAPTIPDAARENTRAGAEAFAMYYWQLADYTQLSGDTEAVLDVSAETCLGCAGAADAIDEIYSAGGTISAAETVVNETNADAIFSAGERYWDVTFEVRTTRQRVTIPGRRPTVNDAATLSGHMTLNWRDGAFRVDILEVGP